MSEKQNKQKASKKNSLQLRQYSQDLYKLNPDQIWSWKRKAYIKHHPYSKKYGDLIYVERGRVSFLTLILGVPCSSGRKHIHGYMDSISWVWGVNEKHTHWVGREMGWTCEDWGRMKMIWITCREFLRTIKWRKDFKFGID